MTAPPSDRARIELFVALASEYDELPSAFPVEQESFTAGPPPRDPAHR